MFKIAVAAAVSFGCLLAGGTADAAVSYTIETKSVPPKAKDFFDVGMAASLGQAAAHVDCRSSGSAAADIRWEDAETGRLLASTSGKTTPFTTKWSASNANDLNTVQLVVRNTSSSQTITCTSYTN
ncbi:hypothetical protein [Amycolatopsis sp. NPDC004378]